MRPESLKYLESHEWIEPEGARRKVGISDFAQDQLGDIVYIEFPDDGKEVARGDEVCVVESTKATGSVYAPLAGKIVACNRALEDAPESVNKSPYDEGWLFEIEPAPGADEAGLLDHAAYKQKTADA